MRVAAKGLSDSSEHAGTYENEHVKALLLPTLQHALRHYITEADALGDSHEIRIHMTLGKSAHTDSAVDAYAFLEQLTDIPKPPIGIEIREFHRENPTLKTLDWVRFVVARVIEFSTTRDGL